MTNDTQRLIERLRAEQGRLQRVLDTKDINVRRRRTLDFRLKMISQSATALEAMQARVAELESVIKRAHGLLCESRYISVDQELRAALKGDNDDHGAPK